MGPAEIVHFRTFSSIEKSEALHDQRHSKAQAFRENSIRIQAVKNDSHVKLGKLVDTLKKYRTIACSL